MKRTTKFKNASKIPDVVRNELGYRKLIPAHTGCLFRYFLLHNFEL